MVIGVACDIWGSWFKSSHILFQFFPQDPHSEILRCTQRGCDLLDLVVFSLFTVFTAEKRWYTPPETLYFENRGDIWKSKRKAVKSKVSFLVSQRPFMKWHYSFVLDGSEVKRILSSQLLLFTISLHRKKKLFSFSFFRGLPVCISFRALVFTRESRTLK